MSRTFWHRKAHWLGILLVGALTCGCGGKSEGGQPEVGAKQNEENCFGPAKNVTQERIAQEHIPGCACDSQTDAPMCLPDGSPVMFSCFENHWVLISDAPCPPQM